MALFTAETAAIAGRAGAKARWSKPEPEPIPEPGPATKPALADAFKEMALVRVRKQLEAIWDAIDQCKDPRDWDCLTRAKDRLFKEWVHLDGIPGPGNLKPSSKPAKQVKVIAEPQVVTELEPPAQPS